MHRNASAPHIFLTFMLLVGLFFGAFGPSLVNALGENSYISWGVKAVPEPVSFTLQNPSTSPTNADSLTFRVTFSGPVSGVGFADFKVHDNAPDGNTTTTAPVYSVVAVSATQYDVIIYGGDLISFNGVVGLDFSDLHVINDMTTGLPISMTEPSIDETYLVDNEKPNVVSFLANGLSNPATSQPVLFTVIFSEKIDPATFTESDISNAVKYSDDPSPFWSIIPSVDNITFDLKASTTKNNITIMPYILSGQITDPVGNSNNSFIKDCNNPADDFDHCVNLIDSEGPIVTIERASDQAEQTGTLPIRFTVTFSEAIDPGTFTQDDIIQANPSVSLWNIADSGDHKTFTLSAMTVSAYGTLSPSIPADSVEDIFGNTNDDPGTCTDSVSYQQMPPTNTPTPQARFKTVVISEIAWMGTSSQYPSDEWIELYNNTNATVDLEGWHLVSFKWSGTSTNGSWSKGLDIVFEAGDEIGPRTSNDPNDTSGYFLLQHGTSSTDYDGVRDILGASLDQIKIYTTYLLSDSGEILLLCSEQNMAAGVCNVNNKSKLVDYVNASWTGIGSSNPWPAGKGSPLYGTMERKYLLSDEDEYWYTHTATSPRYGHDRNWNGTTANSDLINGTPLHENWAFDVTATPRPTATPTRTRTPVAIPGPLLVLNEVLPRAGSDWNNDGKVDVYDEFIEVVNPGSVNVNLKDFKLDDSGAADSSSPFSLPNQTLKPGEIAVFFSTQTGIRLEDSGDTVRLLRASNNTLIDSVAYPIASNVDTSVCRYTDAYGSWLTNCFPTPGRPNALSGDRAPSTFGGAPIPVCFLPDTAPNEFVLAECGEEGPGIWNYNYWNSFPGEGGEIWQVDPDDKWLVIYQ